MSFTNCIQMLLRKLLKNMGFFSRRVCIQGILKNLPNGIFPNYRILVSPLIIECNRKTLNFFSSEEDSSWSCSSDERKPSRTCCKYCRQLYQIKKPARTYCYALPHLNTIDTYNPQAYEYTAPIEFKPAKAKDFETSSEINDEPISISSSTSSRNDVFRQTPLRRITSQELQSVNLKPLLTNLELPKTPEAHEMMAVLRRRFTAMHSPSLEDVSGFGSSSNVSRTSWSSF